MSESPSFASLLARVEKPGRYVGGEWNEIRKRPDRVDVKVALAFPDVYEIGMSYLGQKILYSLLNRDRRVLAERVFAPWPDFERELRAARLPLRSLENGIPLGDFDIVGFSLLYELNYSNVLTILDLGGIPLLSRDRDGVHPLVIGGGPAAFNPEPVADIFDLFLIGDGEEAFPELVREFRALRAKGGDRREILRGLSGVAGVYVPSLYTPESAGGTPLLVPRPVGNAPARIEKRLLRDFARSHFPKKIVVPSLRVIHDRVAVEAARGCPQNCRFCQAASLYFPPRVKDPDFVRETVVDSLRQTGYEDASLTALSIGDYPYLEETVRCLMDELSREKISLSLSSLRPRTLSRELVENILKVRKTGFTLVPEAGTERLRAVINKKLRDEDIRDALGYAFSSGWRVVKLYFMAGLPTETGEDIEGIVRLVRSSLDLGRSILGSPPRINVSLSSFIPKPHTPFQWLGMEDMGTLREKRDYIRSELRRHRSVEFRDHPLETSVLEAVFSRGDRRLTRVLVRAWSKGARFDSWGDRRTFPIWEEAAAEEGVDFRPYLGPLDRGAELPWAVIGTGLRTSHFEAELGQALRGEPSPPCGGRLCAECNGCDLRFWKQKRRPRVLPPAPSAPDPLGERSESLNRYRAFYAKKGKAKYLSHIDLIHVIQRGFRRAGISVRMTEGFHPKPDFCYGPALPLGMEGLREVLEFRAFHGLDEVAFLNRINRSLPPGVRFSGLQRLDSGAPSLYAATVGAVYSLACERAAVGTGPPADGLGLGSPSPCTPAGLRAKLENHVTGGIEGRPLEFWVKWPRVYFRLPSSPGKSLRPQDLVREALGIEHAAFRLRREAVCLAPAASGIDMTP